MAVLRPFKAIRPREELAGRVAALPYDVYNREEALGEVKKEPLSFLCIDRAETGLEASVEAYHPTVYQKAKELLAKMVGDGTFISDQKACYYIYELTMDGREQTGIVACAAIDDYLSNTIKKHEKTRTDKEQDRINHVDICDAQTGPIFLAYRSEEVINQIVEKTKAGEVVYDFISPDVIRHRVWVIDNIDDIEALYKAFESIHQIYIADGHHRAASAVKVGLKRREDNPGYQGEEEFNYFLSVLFPHDQLKILPYNRVVKDLNHHLPESFLNKIADHFLIEENDEKPYAPDKKGKFGMFLNDKWYILTAKSDILSDDPVKGLDVSVLQDYLLTPVLGITDPKTDKRIDFVGGIRGLKELEKRCHADMKVAFSMYPTSIEELFDIADAGELMPPKSTWFEPKLRSGLFIHKLS